MERINDIKFAEKKLVPSKKFFRVLEFAVKYCYPANIRKGEPKFFVLKKITIY